MKMENKLKPKSESRNFIWILILIGIAAIAWDTRSKWWIQNKEPTIVRYSTKGEGSKEHGHRVRIRNRTYMIPEGFAGGSVAVIDDGWTCTGEAQCKNYEGCGSECYEALNIRDRMEKK